MNKIITLATCLTLTALLHAQTILYVTPNGSGDGKSWTNACNLEKAVKTAVSGDQIWVKKGMHHPSKMLTVPAFVKVYGGFVGTETDLSQRNFTANPTIVDAQQKFGSVFRLENSAELDGFTIQNGDAQGNPHKNGGGVWADENTAIRYCTITGNAASVNGGGIYAKGNITLSNTIAENNVAMGNGADLWGNCIDTEILIDYTGAPQEVLLEPGTYTIECWGAQGTDGLARGGYGGYVKGVIKMDEPLQLFVYVGGKASSFNSNINTVGSTYYWGGGASDVRLIGGTWSDVSSLRSRIAVAGGGGAGAGTDESGVARSEVNNNRTAGGGLVGLNTARPNDNEGGTQTTAGRVVTSTNWGRGLPGGFGYGGYAEWPASGNGGGGYYGGGGGAPTASGNDGNGAGGSAFISGHPGCNAIDQNGVHTGIPVHYSGIQFTETVILGGSQSMPNPRGSGDITGNPGHGFVRITFRK